MARDLVSEDLGSITRPGGGRERVSSGKTRVSLVPLQWRLAAIGLVIAAALLWPVLSGPSPAPDRIMLAGHTRLVEAVLFSPDGRTLASCGFDQKVRLWDVSRPGGKRPAEVEVLPHSSIVFSMAFSPDGSRLAAATDRSVTIWSRDQSYHREVERSGEYRRVVFSPDGRTLALGADDGTVRLWDMPEARERAILRGHAAAVVGLAFSPDGSRLASGGREGRLVVWDAAAGTELRVLVGSGQVPIRSVAFSPDGRSVGVAEPTLHWASDIRLFDVETGAVRTSLRGHHWGINDLAFSPDGRTLATAGLDHTVRLWDLAAGKERAVVEDGRWLKSVAFSPDGRWLAYCGSDEDIRLLDLDGRRPDAPGVPRTVRDDRRQAVGGADEASPLPSGTSTA
jgi:WD40 repeat protein